MGRLGGYCFVTLPDRAGRYYIAAYAAGGMNYRVGDLSGYGTRSEAEAAKARYDRDREREDAIRHADRLRST